MADGEPTPELAQDTKRSDSIRQELVIVIPLEQDNSNPGSKKPSR